MHYHFDSEDETLKAWTLGLGSHPLSWEEIQKTATNNSVSFRSLAKRKVIYESLENNTPLSFKTFSHLYEYL